jgi:hypothetical protein
VLNAARSTDCRHRHRDLGVGLSDDTASILASAISPQEEIVITLDADGEIVVTLGNADPSDEHLAGLIFATRRKTWRCRVIRLNDRKVVTFVGHL